MNTRKKQLVGVLAAVNIMSLLAAGNVMADMNAKRMNYGTVKLGMFQPTGDMDDANYDNGGDVSLAYGRYLNEFVSVEAGFDIFAADQTVRGSNAQAGRYEQDNVLGGVGLLLTVKGEYSTGPIDLFAGFGAGFYSVTLDSEIDSTQLGDLNSDESDGVFGAHVVAGATYNINDRFFLALEGKYRWTDDVDIHDTVASIPIDYTGDLSGYLVTFNGGFRF